MSPDLFAKLHGASTHLPLVFVASSWAFDTAAFLAPQRNWSSELKNFAYWSMALGALGSVPAVATGLVMSRGEVLGHDTLRMHHLFVWPAFGLTMLLATWRLLSKRHHHAPARWQFAVYLAGGLVATVLMSGAGYWGGELLLES
ncbi:MAG TPA: DUF2231 domain-containing protein [Opitutaceae bacterium]|nr:DUF2231 domain-containing protein [Opitutaceae bacterium]